MTAELWQALLAVSALFFIVDPIGVLPIFVSITTDDSPEKRRKMAAKACWVAGAILVGFAIAGGALFKLLGVTMPAFKVAGGIALLLSGIEMLRGQSAPLKTSAEEQAEGAAKEDVAIVPLAMPLLAGPGSIATVMVLISRAEGAIATAGVLVAIVATMLASYLILRTAEYTDRWITTTTKTILVRVMGLLLAAIAVQFTIEGTVEALRALGAL